MRKGKIAQKTLLASILALVLCFSLVLGTTFAWFTDSANSGNNTITAGTLDVQLEYKTRWSNQWQPVDETTKLFAEGAFYEPGFTERVYLRVSNIGTLAFKYMLSINIANNQGSVNVYGEEFKLTDYIKVGTYVQDEYRDGVNVADTDIPAMFETRNNALNNVTLNTLFEADPKICDNAPLLPGEDTAQIVVIVLTMPEEVGNETNVMPGEELPFIEMGLRLYASQYTYESDSFNDQYDTNTDQPAVHTIFNNDDLYRAFDEGGQGIIENMNLTDVQAELASNKTLALNTNNSTISGTDDDYVIVNHGDLQITGDGTIVNNMKGSIENWGKLYVNNLNIVVAGTKYGFHCKAGEVEINQLVLTSERGGLNVQGGKVTVNSCDVTYSGYYDTANKKWLAGYLVYAGGDTSEVVINGGTFIYTGTNAKQRVICAEYGAKVSIYGGTFGKGGKNVPSTWLWEREGGDIVIYGGTFQFDPSICVAEGYQAVQGADGWWTVTSI